MSIVDEWQLLSKNFIDLKVMKFLELMKIDVVEKMRDGEKECAINKDAQELIQLNSEKTTYQGIGAHKSLCKIDKSFLNNLESNGFHLVKWIWGDDHVSRYEKMNLKNEFQTDNGEYELSLAW